ncbi:MULTISPECIES: aminotransferase class I/II-fold pyridoxal phosphate-dependent enzyme [Sanguibacteroides]|uniref:Aminotransferase n=1 Tax=Sanguibacteroides justesenii TaxID=1547597 RepID=A0A0C3ME52_9PORP|nr:MULTISPECIES: pyridoxal phosphate-dependent aminotransferase [Sanguibacteroides]KIO44718.1 aminotransferase [Sanguibacteroides justesenii]PXZ43317.1 pyridoxal phosphate-dependent aminotransferase [Sanguibacteroides justesenii]
MQNNLIDTKIVDQKLELCGIRDMEDATIRDIVKVVNMIEAESGEKFIRMEMGVPGLPPSSIGIQAEIDALRQGVAQFYPMLEGHKEFKEEGSKFVKNFMDIEIKPEGIVPTVGSMQACYASFMAVTECQKGKDTVLFIDPGFPVQKTQMQVIGKPFESFDVYNYRGDKLRDKLEEHLSKGNIAAILYSNPNNPAWICFTEKELQIIGQLADKYNVIVLEDLAYFAMDFRKDLSKPGVPPFQATVAKYTSNYIVMISGSKLFSYAGQRLGIMCISDALYNRKFENLQQRFGGLGTLGYTLVNRIIYTLSSGTTHSCQYAMSAILKAANEGRINILDGVREYAERAHAMKTLFTQYGFEIVYDKDIDQPIADGFYFTIIYPGMTGAELTKEILYYGISAIPLRDTGSKKQGLRACVSQTALDRMPALEKRLKAFQADHAIK